MDFSLPNDAARALFFSTHVVPLLERLNISQEDQESLNDGLKLIHKRWSKYPDFNPSQLKDEISELLSRLAKNAKLVSEDEGLHRHNDIVVEIIHSILNMTKHFYTVGVEFGQELDAIHEVLCAVGHLIPKVKLFTPSVTNSCSCVVDSLRVDHSFVRTDGDVWETFTGPSSIVVQQAMLCLWRDMILAHLSKPENEMDTSSFITSRLPSLLQDIIRNPGVGLTLSTIRPLMDPDDVTPGDEDPIAYDTYLDPDEDEDMATDDDDWEDDENTDDDMPPLTDASGALSDRDSDSDGPPPLEPIAHSGRTNREGLPKLVPESGTPAAPPTASLEPPGLATSKVSGTTSPILSGDYDKSNAEQAGRNLIERNDEDTAESDEDKDGDEEDDNDEDSSSDLGRELDDEDDQRMAQRPRLQKLIDLWTFKSFLAAPSADGYEALRNIWNSRRQGLPTKLEIFESLLTMHHSSGTFAETARIFVTEGATAQLHKLVHQNPHLHSRASLAMRNIVIYFAGDPRNRSRAEPLLYAAMKGVLQDMVLEIEWAFRGLTTDKCEEYSSIMKKPVSERAALLAIWVNSLESPKPKAFSEEAQANTGPAQPFLMDPFGIFAALGVNMVPQTSDPLMIDPLEGLDDFTPDDADYDPLVNRYRPDHSQEFEQWQSVVTQAGDLDRACLITPQKLFLDLMQIAPWTSNKVVVKDLKSKCDSGRQRNIQDMLATLNRFAVTEGQNVKKAVAAKKTKAKLKASAASSTTGPADSLLSATESAAAAKPTTSVPLSNTANLGPIFGITVPASILGLPPMTGDPSHGLEWSTMPSSFNDVD